MTTRADVVAEARSQLGARWQHGAALRDVAMDCYGLITVVGLALGVKEAAQWSVDPVIKGYGRSPDGAALIAACRRYLDPVPILRNFMSGIPLIGRAGLGDILAIRWETEPQHLAIISRLDPMCVIHSYATARKVAENSIDGVWRHGKTWRSLVDSAWRFRGIDD